MIYFVEYADEAGGMVRYGEERIEAANSKQALKIFAENHKNSGPGFFATGEVRTEKAKQSEEFLKSRKLL